MFLRDGVLSFEEGEAKRRERRGEAFFSAAAHHVASAEHQSLLPRHLQSLPWTVAGVCAAQAACRGRAGGRAGCAESKGSWVRRVGGHPTGLAPRRPVFDVCASASP